MNNFKIGAKPFNNNNIKDLSDVLTQRGDRVTHGDVIIIKCDKTDFPSEFESLKDEEYGTLAYGEVTGHSHSLMYDDQLAYQVVKKFNPSDYASKPTVGSYKLKKVSDTELYLEVTDGPVLLKHQEHSPYRIYPGCYEIGIQQEVDHFTNLKRSVID